jgi:NAD(P)H dehydrogenase (quinone)
MKRRVLKVIAHPVPTGLVRSAGDAAESALKSAGHDVRVIDLYAEGFDPVMSRVEWQRLSRNNQTVQLDQTDDFRTHSEALQWATDILLVYPTWYGNPPAMLKGWFDRVWTGGGWTGGVSGGDGSVGGKLTALRNITNIWVVTSHGSPKYMNMVAGEGGKKLIVRVLRLQCARLCRVRWVAFYGNDTATETDRIAYLERVTRRFSQVH